MANLPFDALQAVAAAGARWVTVPAQTYTPPATTDDPDPQPYTVPARDVIEVDPDTLPPEVLQPDGRVSLTQQVAMLQEAVRRQRQDVRLRSVHGQAVFASTLIWAGGSTQDVPVTWDTAADAPVEAAIARLDVGVAWQGKLSARIKPGSITQTGCRVLVQVTSSSQVVITAALPLTVHADGLYNYLPPYQGGS